MNKLKTLLLASSFILVSAALSGCSGGASADGKTHLTFQIWDVAQRDGMQAICDAYTEQNPNVEIELQDLGTLQLQDYDSLCGEKRTYYSVRQMAHKRTLREKKGRQENRNNNENKDS